MGHHVMRGRGARRAARRAACAGPWWQGAAAAADDGHLSVRRAPAARTAELGLLLATVQGMAPWRAVKGHRGAGHVDGAGAGCHWRLNAPQQRSLAAAKLPCTAPEPACSTSVAPLARPGMPRAPEARAPANVAAPSWHARILSSQSAERGCAQRAWHSGILRCACFYCSLHGRGLATLPSGLPSDGRAHRGFFSRHHIRHADAAGSALQALLVLAGLADSGVCRRPRLVISRGSVAPGVPQPE